VADPDTKKFLEDVKTGKPRRFVMIGKGIKIISLIVYKKGTVEAYKKKAKEEGTGHFYHGVVGGKGQNIIFYLSTEDGFEKPPGKELILKDHLASKIGMKCKPTYEIVEQLPEVSEDDDEASPDSNEQTAPVDASDLAARLDQLRPSIKQFVVTYPDRRLEILKPMKAANDFVEAPDSRSRDAAVSALATWQRSKNYSPI